MCFPLDSYTVFLVNNFYIILSHHTCLLVRTLHQCLFPLHHQSTTEQFATHSGGTTTATATATAGASESLSNDSMSSEDRMRLRGTQIQYAVCSPDYLSFGASLSHATNAIRMDSDLRVCVCGPSDTFGNDDNNIVTDSEPIETRFQDIRVTLGIPTVPLASSSSLSLAAGTIGSDRTYSFDIKEVEVFALNSAYNAK